MPKIRNLPYGYCIRDGKTLIDENAAKIVCNIFAAYIAGETMQNIAADLTVRRIFYGTDNGSWNKNTIQRILEKPIYYGNNIYPAIISKNTFLQASDIRAQRHVSYTADLKVIRKDILCSHCKTKLIWLSKRQEWHCPVCLESSQSITPTQLLQQIAERMRFIQAAPDIIQTPPTSSLCSIEAAELDRTITQALYTGQFHTDELLHSILRRSELRYKFCTLQETDPMTLRLKRILVSAPPIHTFDPALYKSCVSKIILHRNTQIDLQLINGQLL